jgi:hypothetical protein
MRRLVPTRSRGFALLISLTAVAGLAACQAPAPAPSTPVTATGPAPTATATTSTPSGAWPTDSAGDPVGWQVCRNTVHHYEIAYPGGWHTASVGIDDACSVFDPSPFTAVDGLAPVTQQLFARYASEDALDYVAELFPADFFTVTSQVDTTVAGLHAIRYTVTTLPPRGPSGPTYPVGSTLYGYVVTAGARSVNVSTWAAPADAAALPQREHIVDQAATTVHFT